MPQILEFALIEGTRKKLATTPLFSFINGMAFVKTQVLSTFAHRSSHSPFVFIIYVLFSMPHTTIFSQ